MRVATVEDGQNPPKAILQKTNLMFGLWSLITWSAREVANQLNVEGLNLVEGEGGGGDGLAALSEKAKREKSVRLWIWE